MQRKRKSTSTRFLNTERFHLDLRLNEVSHFIFRRRSVSLDLIQIEAYVSKRHDILARQWVTNSQWVNFKIVQLHIIPSYYHYLMHINSTVNQKLNYQHSQPPIFFPQLDKGFFKHFLVFSVFFIDRLIHAAMLSNLRISPLRLGLSHFWTLVAFLYLCKIDSLQ